MIETTLYLVRHCEADGNKHRIFHGHFDSDITENGKKQLELLAERFENIPFDKVYSSDLKRAFLTASTLSSAKKISVTQVQGLREIHGGEWENVDFEEIAKRFPDEFKMWTKNPECFCMPGGESYLEFFERIKKAIHEIISANQGKTIVIATHGTVIKLYLSFASGLALSQSEQIPWCDNTAVSKLIYDKNVNPKIIFMNDNSHLTADTETLAAQKWWKKYISEKNGKDD